MPLPSHYNVTNAMRIVQNPKMVRGEFNRLGVCVNAKFRDWGYPSPEPDLLVMKEDWDNLIILDACRYDYYHQENTIEGDLEPRISHSSHSTEFFHENFPGQYHDTVYLTANAFSTQLDSGTFHDIWLLFDTDWDDSLGVVPPDAVVDATKQAHEEHPDKRLIVHFMQPHTPFIGDVGQTIPDKPISEPDAEIRSVWTNIRYGLADVSISEIREAYRENLRIVLEHVSDLLDELDGKSVITADHGELLGERLRPIPVRGFGHVEDARFTELRTVPWLVVESKSSERREVKPDPPISNYELDSEVVVDRLQKLGYVA